MNKIVLILSAALLGTALSAPLSATDEDVYAGETHSEAVSKASKEAPAAKPKKAAAKPAAKKRRRKKKAAPVSEYRFKSDSVTPTYKFDKRADPILKKSKKKKKSSAKGKSASSSTKAKLQPVKSFNDPGDQAGEAGGTGGIQLPPGVNIPGMGGQ